MSDQPFWEPNPENKLDCEVYRFLMNYYLYQDQISWNRVQTLVAIEGGLIAAGFSNLKGPIAIVALILGSILIYLIWRLVQRDWEIRDQYLVNILDKVHRSRGIRITPEAGTIWNKGGFLYGFIIWSIIFINTTLAVYFLVQYISSNV